jgi:hypothetical protein
VFLLLTGVIQQAHAQVVDWVESYVVGRWSYIEDAVSLPDGGYFLVGHAWFPEDSGGVQGIVIRTNDSGQMLWWRMYGGVTDDYFLSATMVGGEIWVGGTFDATGSEFYVSTLWRLSVEGDSLWARRYSGLYNTIEKVKPAPDGGVLVTTSGSYVLVKIDAEGDVAWTVDGTDYHGRVRAIDVRSDGTTVVACQNTTEPFSDTLAINVYWIDANGHVQDMSQYHPSAWAGAESVIALSDSDAVVAGWIQTGPNFFDQSPYLFRIGRSGMVAWEVTRSDEWARNAVGIHSIHDSLTVVTWKPFTEAGWGNPLVSSFALNGTYSHQIVVDVTPGQSAYVYVSATAQVAMNRLLVMGSRDIVADTLGTQSFCAQVSFGPAAVGPQNDQAPGRESALSIEYVSGTGRILLPENPLGAVQVRVFDILGRLVHQSTQTQTTRQFSVPLDCASGTFLISVTDARKEWHGTVHILR